VVGAAPLSKQIRPECQAAFLELPAVGAHRQKGVRFVHEAADGEAHDWYLSEARNVNSGLPYAHPSFSSVHGSAFRLQSEEVIQFRKAALMFTPLFSKLLLIGCLIAPAALLAQDEPAPRSRPAGPSQQRPDLQQVNQHIVAKVNAFRQQQDRSPLKVDPHLTEAAHYFANYMARTGKFSHTADGTEPWDRAKKFGYDYCMVEENIAYEFSSEGFGAEELAKAFVTGWEHSPGHRKNMLNRDVVETGVAVARSEATGKYYAVQMFGRPKSMEMEFRVVNETESPVRYRLDKREVTVQPHFSMIHRACVRPRLEFEVPSAEEVYRPSNGARFVLRQNAEGKITVERQ
jgi:uncharacterized protein YkwD